MALEPEQLATVPGWDANRAAALARAFADAYGRPFSDWLRALGAPGDAVGAGGNWAALTVQGEDGWRRRGVGAARARQLAAFFANPEVRSLAAQLHLAGVQGF